MQTVGSDRRHGPSRARLAVAVLAVVVATGVTAGCADRTPGVVAVPDTTGAAAATSVATSVATPTSPPVTVAASTTDVAVPATTIPSPTASTAPATAPPTSPPTTSPPTTAAPSAGALLALDVLGSIRVENEHRGGYVRDAFGYPADLDGDGCNTRAEVLEDEAAGLVQISQPGCVVLEGDWVSLYDGAAVTDAAELEIDHVVALKEAWDSGAWRWDPLTMMAFANDVTDGRTLRAVTAATNRSKSDKDPSNWLPPSAAAVCEFLGDWVAIKARWSLTMDRSEYGRIRNVLNGDCAGTTTARFVPVEAARGYLDRPFVDQPSPTTAPAGGATGDVYYQNCAAARAAGAAPLYAGEPGYRPGLDGDKDGVACEG